ncbi:RNA ligase family protein [Paraflavisolibacter sp. H34]|uniref:RNA ligase family protein n=1 Tax=Huijunlia imazamoxiresistens TaxID=3127457 RepID=UPI00301832BC
MALSEKYGRTGHYPFSPGATHDDRVHTHYWHDLQAIGQLVHTEKLDGENNCLSRHGVFARSHAAPTTSPWTATLRQYWQQVKHDLGFLEVFLENLYAVHSLRYRQLEHHFYVFAIREHDRWLSWEETQFYAALLDLPVVPQLAVERPPASREAFERSLVQLASGPGAFAPVEACSGLPATMEGIVSRDAAGYPTADFAHRVFKYVRKGHVTTDAHWTRHWKRAPLKQEGGNHVEAD